MSGSRFSRFRTNAFWLSPILLVFVTYFHGLPDSLASSPRQKPRYQENEPTDGPEPTPVVTPKVAPPPQVRPHPPNSVPGNVGSHSPASVPSVAPHHSSATPTKLQPEKPLSDAAVPVDNREEKILEIAFKKLKGQDVQGGMRALNQLTTEFPDNPDYALLYRMALKRQEAQQWYRYQDWVEQKQVKAKPFVQMTQTLKKETPQPGRINELKRATWVILATGKYPSPEPARKVIIEPEDVDAK